MLCLLFPTNGIIKLNNKLLNKKNINQWQQLIAHVPQNIFLSDSTIIENIAFGVPIKEINLERVKEVAKVANISNFIESLDDNYYSLVGENGNFLSGGQKQRIGIARALYNTNSKVIVFDEATSSLDNQTEKKIMKDIYSLSSKYTLIIVAHRLSTLSKCDQVYIIENGKIKVR